MEDRIIQLETLSAMQDETIRQLNGEIYEQQRDIAKLLARLEALEEKIAERSDSAEIAGNERPPHY